MTSEPLPSRTGDGNAETEGGRRYDEFHESVEMRRLVRVEKLLTCSSADHLRFAAELTADARRAEEVNTQLLWALAKQGQNR